MILELILAFSFLLFLITLLALFIIIPALFGAPFQPTSRKNIKQMIFLASAKKSDKVADLGSGSGTLVIAFAKKGIESHGFEINPFLVWYSRRKIKKLGLKNAHIYWKNFWRANLEKFNIITIFQISYAMPTLEKKLKKELKKNSKIISNTWRFPNLSPEKKLKKVYLYRI